MKFLAFILSLHFFAASIIPCSDVSTILSSAYGDQAAHQSESETGDDCSTLCVCNCCGIVFTAMTVFVNLSTPQILSSVPFTNTHEPLSYVRNPIWQPPKIS